MKGLKNMKGLKKNKKGFTLIELLAVIVILGILMLVAIPSVTRFINQSRQKTFKNAAQMIIDAVRNDAVNNQVASDCNVEINDTNIKLEKGNINEYVGYVTVDRDDNNATYTYSINIIDKKNDYHLIASEGAIDGLKFATSAQTGSDKFYRDTANTNNTPDPKCNY